MTANPAKTQKRKHERKQADTLTLHVTIILDDEPSAAYLDLWRRLLAPIAVPTPPQAKGGRI